MARNQERIDALRAKEARVGRIGLTPSERQELVDEGTGQNQSVTEMVGGTVDNIKETLIPKKQIAIPSESSLRLYDNEQDKANYDQKFQDAKNSVKEKESYSEILNRLAKQKEQDSVDQMALDHFKNVGQEPEIPAPPKFDNEQAKKQALMEMMARKQNK